MSIESTQEQPRWRVKPVPVHYYHGPYSVRGRLWAGIYAKGFGSRSASELTTHLKRAGVGVGVEDLYKLSLALDSLFPVNVDKDIAKYYNAPNLADMPIYRRHLK